MERSGTGRRRRVGEFIHDHRPTPYSSSIHGVRLLCPSAWCGRSPLYNPQPNAHITETREVCYPWHPWYGRTVTVREALTRRHQAVLRWCLDSDDGDKALEIPHCFRQRLLRLTRFILCSLRASRLGRRLGLLMADSSQVALVAGGICHNCTPLTTYFVRQKIVLNPLTPCFYLPPQIMRQGWDLGDTLEAAQLAPPDLAVGDYIVILRAGQDNNRETLSSAALSILEPTNQSPVCDDAVESPSLLWPPNHKFVDVQITGITDPDSESAHCQCLKRYPGCSNSRSSYNQLIYRSIVFLVFVMF